MHGAPRRDRTHERVIVLLAEEGLLPAIPPLSGVRRIAWNDHSCNRSHSRRYAPVNLQGQGLRMVYTELRNSVEQN